MFANPLSFAVNRHGAAPHCAANNVKTPIAVLLSLHRPPALLRSPNSRLRGVGCCHSVGGTPLLEPGISKNVFARRFTSLTSSRQPITESPSRHTVGSQARCQRQRRRTVWTCSRTSRVQTKMERDSVKFLTRSRPRPPSLWILS